MTLAREYKGDLKHMNRVMTILSNALEPVPERKIIEAACTSQKYIKPCVRFLARWGLIGSEMKKRAVIYYSIKNANDE